MDYDYWLMKGYDEKSDFEMLFNDFCQEKAMAALPDGDKYDWAEWIDEHEAELLKEFKGE